MRFLQISLWAAGEPAEPLLNRLDPVLRTRVLMALLGLLLVGMLLIMMVLIGGRYVRRLAKQRPGTSDAPGEDWYRKPLNEQSPSDEE